MARVEFREVKERDAYDPFALNNEASFTQSYAYGEWRRAVDVRVRRVIGVLDGNTVLTAQILVQRLPLGRAYHYIPHGPVLADTASAVAVRGEWFCFLSALAVRDRAIFTRFDPFPVDAGHEFIAGSVGIAPVTKEFQGSSVQPQHERALDLTRSEDALMRSFDKDARYCMRVAEKKQVRVELIEKRIADHLGIFWGIIHDTARRDGFRTYPKPYYRTVMKCMDEEKNGVLAIARIGDVAVAAALIVIAGDTATYLFAGSRSAYRDAMAPYALQWKVITAIKHRGISRYSLGAVNVSGDTREAWEGITRFKNKFGGEVINFGSVYDVVHRPALYRAYRMAKTIRLYVS